MYVTPHRRSSNGTCVRGVRGAASAGARSKMHRAISHRQTAPIGGLPPLTCPLASHARTPWHLRTSAAGLMHGRLSRPFRTRRI